MQRAGNAQERAERSGGEVTGPLAVFGHAVSHVCAMVPSLAVAHRRMVGRNKAGKRAASCTGKARHKSHDAASIEARRADDARVQPYPCKFCNGWHVGSAA